MRYLWQSGDAPTMHIQRPSFDELSMEALCKAPDLNRSVNSPFQLGRPLCKSCVEIAEKLGAEAA